MDYKSLICAECSEAGARAAPGIFGNLSRLSWVIVGGVDRLVVGQGGQVVAVVGDHGGHVLNVSHAAHVAQLITAC